MKKNLLLLTFAVLFFLPSFSQTLYTSTTEAGYVANPGRSALGTPRVFFDDVLIPSTLVQGTDSISITKLKFGVYRTASAPAVTVNMYYTIVEDTATSFNTVTRIPPVLIGTINLPANGPTAGTSIIALGDSVTPIFRIKTDTGYLFTDYQSFFVGLSFSATTGLGWSLTVPGAPQSDNANGYWVYNGDSTVKTYVTGFGNPPNPSATFYVQVFGKGFNTLPVTLAEFNARRSGKINMLNWTTQQELNTRSFVVERSTDGRKYTSIGQVAAAGNSSTVRNYAFTDAQPSKGINYYRLRTTDKDNSSKLSAIRSIRNAGLADISIYPNPVTDKLTIMINADRATSGYLTISDINGKSLYSRSVKLPQGNTALPVLLDNFAAGSYIMKIQMDDDIIIKKFNKQ
ncbi:MAG: T9SS type A sorting domain-containing protein [Ferruginibacter sp.]